MQHAVQRPAFLCLNQRMDEVRHHARQKSSFVDKKRGPSPSMTLRSAFSIVPASADTVTGKEFTSPEAPGRGARVKSLRQRSSFSRRSDREEKSPPPEFRASHYSCLTERL
jgi:hypothetical protein